MLVWDTRRFPFDDYESLQRAHVGFSSGEVRRSLTSNANSQRNAAGGSWQRRRRSRPALWALLDEYVAADARVAVVGAGNADDLPLVASPGSI